MFKPIPYEHLSVNTLHLIEYLILKSQLKDKLSDSIYKDTDQLEELTKIYHDNPNPKQVELALLIWNKTLQNKNYFQRYRETFHEKRIISSRRQAIQNVYAPNEWTLKYIK